MLRLLTNKTAISKYLKILFYALCTHYSMFGVDQGRVVKGIKFKQIRDAGNPVEVAKAYQEQGADELVFLDITASSDERQTMRDVVEETVASCFMPVTVGGGIRELNDIRNMLLCGADKVSLNTAAILNPDLINQASSQFGNQCMVAIDAKNMAQKTDGLFTLLRS